jgi:glycosyltransferase involved in cell wall biosynthesis
MLTVSVVVPSFNQGIYLEECLASLVAQDRVTPEILVLDGGSQDNSVEIIKRYEPHLSYWRSHPDEGQAAALAEGFQRCTGDIFCWLNSDDALLPTALRRVVDAFEHNSFLGWMFGDSLIVDHNSSPVILRTGLAVTYRDLLNGTYHLPQESTFFRRELYRRSGGVNPKFDMAMDYDLWLRLAELEAPHYLPGTLGIFRRHDAQKSSDRRRYDADVRRAKAPHQTEMLGLPQRLLVAMRLRARVVYHRVRRVGLAPIMGRARILWKRITLRWRSE